MTLERLAEEGHDTLEGVPEPAENPRLFGHDAARQTLLEAHRAGRLPQGLILAGPRGIGKATLAFHLARHLLRFPDGRSAPDGMAEPDPASSVFRQVASGAHPSVLHLARPLNDKGTGFKTVISVDEVRRIARFLSHTGHDGGYRIVVVDPADDLNAQAANALLKNLEEPPARTIFLLVTHALGRLLPTLRSRCQAVRLAPLSTPDLIAALSGLVTGLPESAAAAEELRARAGGSVREAILLIEEGGLELAAALDAIAASPRFDPLEAHRLADAVSARGRDAAMGLMRGHALELVATAASEAGRRGDLARAERLAEFWARIRQGDDDAAAFNLDRKQRALELIGRMHAALRG